MSLSEKVYSLNLTIFILSFLKVNFADQFLLRRVVMRPDRLCLIKKKKSKEKQRICYFFISADFVVVVAVVYSFAVLLV